VRRDWTCEPKERVRSKVTPRNLGAGLNVGLRGFSKSELGLMRSLMGIRTEEATFTFIGVDWEAPFQEPFFKVVEGLLDSVSSFQWVWGGRLDGEIISIECLVPRGRVLARSSTYRMKRAGPRTEP